MYENEWEGVCVFVEKEVGENDREKKKRIGRRKEIILKRRRKEKEV